MSDRVAIIGVGCSDVRSTTPGVSYRELTFDAATRAYADAGIDVRREVGSFVDVAEDYWEGTSIFDEYAPDQMGAAQRPVQTIGGEGIQGLLAAYMQIRAGLFDCVVVESHSKRSNVLDPNRVLAFGLDPILNRPLGLNPHFIAGLEMRRFLHDTGATREQCAAVVAKNRRNALANPYGAHAANLGVEDVLAAPPIADPLGKLDVSPGSDGAVVLVLASEEFARAHSGKPIWVRGGAYCTETPNLESRDWSRATCAALAAERAYRMAGISDPATQIDLAEVDDTYSYKELQHLEALGLAPRGQAGVMAAAGAFDRGGSLPVNVSGGSLGMGHLLDASGLFRVAELVWQLRGEAGPRQLKRAGTGLAFGWRGVPTTTGALVILSN